MATQHRIVSHRTVLQHRIATPRTVPQVYFPAGGVVLSLHGVGGRLQPRRNACVSAGIPVKRDRG
ncbi:hypothetical protein K0T92_21165 [Paenibacillus oenotherae]|uniref:Uncharacterized protein n=1 Tax=Paenibacillus oenotherae TaxID=1435645 RepID=A0ABS7DC71_9BACL|nr:hypothetical protein [Paenibacillus oenotherae]MBW7477231.1 hypothetical protein [Paenibacillus oenotherae]